MAREKFAEIAILLHESDDLAVLKKPVKAGDELMNGSIRLEIRQDIRAGHKIAIRTVPAGGAIRKYGQVIGLAQSPIAAGEHIHTHNLELSGSGRDYEFGTTAQPVTRHPPDRKRTRLNS